MLRPIFPVSDVGSVSAQAVIGPSLQRAYRCIPLGLDGEHLRIGVAGELSAEVLRELAFATGKRIEQVAVDSDVIEQHLAKIADSEPSGQAVDALADEAAGQHGDAEPENQTERSGVESSPMSPYTLPMTDLQVGPVVQQVDRIIQRAIRLGASDIHIEPYEETLRVRYRLDGLLHLAGELRYAQREAIVSRIKVLASLDIAEKRRPQDGRISITHTQSDSTGQAVGSGARTVDLRVSVLPTHFGEKAVLRILDRESLRLDLGALGLAGASAAAFHRAIEAPHGMVLVTGPTGSGKTTTLYAALSALPRERLNVTTVEDPIEYDIQGVNQTQARPEIGFSFPEALRAFLRQDPDVIMVGEVRDTETAEVAVRAALTGHLVLSTLHTNDAPSTVTRLVDMGVAPYLVAASVRLVAAQRLVRQVCPGCKEPLDHGQLPKNLERDLERVLGAGEAAELVQGRGCDACGGTGYRGRMAIFEVMPMTEVVARLVADGASTQEVRMQAESEGMESLRQAAVRKLAAGQTTIEEVVRATIA